MSAENTDFERLSPIRVLRREVSIRILTSNDDIALEYDDWVLLIFTPDNPADITVFENRGQYVRTTATVRIIDRDGKW